MPRREDEPVSINPFRMRRAMRKGASIKDSPNFRAAQGQAQMAALAGLNGVDGQAAGSGGGFGKRFKIEGHGGKDEG